MGKSVVTYSSRICHLLALMAPLASHAFQKWMLILLLLDCQACRHHMHFKSCFRTIEIFDRQFVLLFTPRPGTGVILPNRVGWVRVGPCCRRVNTTLISVLCVTKGGRGWGWERGKWWPFRHWSLSALDVSQNLLIESWNGWNISCMSSTQTCSNNLLFLYDML